MLRWYAPLDPECPDVVEFWSIDDDPMTIAYGVDTSEFWESFARKHRGSCLRCQEFGAANIEVR